MGKSKGDISLRRMIASADFLVKLPDPCSREMYDVASVSRVSSGKTEFVY